MARVFVLTNHKGGVGKTASATNIVLEDQTGFRKSPMWAERQLVQRLNEALLSTPAALDYVTRQRGWQ